MNDRRKIRCDWAQSDLAVAYHDEEWAVPVHDDRTLFEFLILEGAQAGLSWETVLKKRERYRKVYDDFDVERVARYSARKRERLLGDAGIIRNRLKIDASIENARVFLTVQEEFGSFGAHLWEFVEGEPIRNRWRRSSEVPSTTPLSERISRDWKRRGFRFVGPTIVYAFLEAVGVVDDHLVTCFRHAELRRHKA